MSALRAVPLALVIALFCGCALAQASRHEELLIKASALTKVATAVESAVRFKDAPPELSESELLRFATEHDPDLLEPFSTYLLRVRRIGMLSSVLLCSQDGQTALIEDAGCTGRSDAHLWNRSPPQPCAFQLDLAEVCGVDVK